MSPTPVTNLCCRPPNTIWEAYQTSLANRVKAEPKVTKSSTIVSSVKVDNAKNALASEEASPSESDSVSEDGLVSEAGHSTRAVSTEPPSLNQRMQELMDTGSPEDLEAEVISCRVFLDNIKKPLLKEASRNKDATHYVNQIGEVDIVIQSNTY